MVGTAGSRGFQYEWIAEKARSIRSQGPNEWYKYTKTGEL